MSDPSAPSSLYEELGDNEIRLLVVTRDENTKEISCTMTTHHLHDRMPYKALSYAWGSEDNQQAIKVNSHRVPIRKNLHHFLQIYDGGHIWIDQICIDQESVLEKNDQVGMMSDIYAFAAATIIWLGPDPFHGLVKNLIETCLSVLQQYQKAARVRWITARSSTPSVMEEQTELSDDIFTSMNNVQMQALEAFYAAPYWTRHWIAQEVAVATTCLVWYGTEQMDWTEVSEFSRGLTETISKARWPAGLEEVVALLDIVQSFHYKDQNPTIQKWYELVSFARNSLCTNQLDKIYGFQSLIEPIFRIEVDYRLTVRSLYLRVVKRRFEQQLPSDRDIERLWFIRCCVILAVGMGLVDNVWAKEVEENFRVAYSDFLDRNKENSRRMKQFGWTTTRRLLIQNVLEFDNRQPKG